MSPDAIPVSCPACGAPRPRPFLRRERLDRLGRSGPVALWGAGAKGATLASLADPDRRRVACLVDVNPGKQGGFLPGTGHPIVAPADLPAFRVARVVALNPNYVPEIAAQLRAVDPDAVLVAPSTWDEAA
jgi:hypothetical protein